MMRNSRKSNITRTFEFADKSFHIFFQNISVASRTKVDIDKRDLAGYFDSA